MEYGNMLYMGAAPSTLKVLDNIQESTMKIGGFEIESLICLQGEKLQLWLLH